VTGQSILSRIFKDWSARDTRVTILAETTFGFFVFATLLLVFALAGFYTLTGLIIILAIMALIGWDKWITLYNDILSFEVSLDHHEEGK
jgi:hypothetical protein